MTEETYIDSDGTELRIEVGDDTLARYLDSQNKLHRLDGPAVERHDGTKYWYQNDQRHRLDGPAREYADGSKEWWVEDTWHRLDGPAVEWAGDKFWFVNGKQVEPLFLVAYWLERGRCCWYDESTQNLCFSDP